jgi:hypothetical protein
MLNGHLVHVNRSDRSTSLVDRDEEACELS